MQNHEHCLKNDRGEYLKIVTNGTASVYIDNGVLKTWGDKEKGGVLPQEPSDGTPLYQHGSVIVQKNTNWNSNFVKVYSNPNAFAALKDNGDVLVWGVSTKGGNSTKINSNSQLIENDWPKNIVEIYSTSEAFAAINKDGHAIFWGDSNSGGGLGTTASKIPFKDTDGNYKKIVKVCATTKAFAFIDELGFVYVQGNSGYGGDKSHALVAQDVATNEKKEWPEDDLYSAVNIYSSPKVFALLNKFGRIRTWGESNDGGNSGKHKGGYWPVKVCSNNNAFAVINKKNNLVVFGDELNGGNIDSLNDNTLNNSLLTNISDVYSNDLAFAAISIDRKTVYIWGDSDYGGDENDPGNVVSYSLAFTNAPVVKIYSTTQAFAALIDNGTVWVRGLERYGGVISDTDGGVPLENICEIYQNDYAFAALTNEGEILAWGDKDKGGLGTANNKVGKLEWKDANNNYKKVVRVYPNGESFIAVDEFGNMFQWGTIINKAVGNDLDKTDEIIQLHDYSSPLYNVYDNYLTDNYENTQSLPVNLQELFKPLSKKTISDKDVLQLNKFYNDYLRMFPANPVLKYSEDKNTLIIAGDRIKLNKYLNTALRNSLCEDIDTLSITPKPKFLKNKLLDSSPFARRVDDLALSLTDPARLITLRNIFLAGQASNTDGGILKAKIRTVSLDSFDEASEKYSLIIDGTLTDPTTGVETDELNPDNFYKKDTTSPALEAASQAKGHKRLKQILIREFYDVLNLSILEDDIEFSAGSIAVTVTLINEAAICFLGDAVVNTDQGPKAISQLNSQNTIGKNKIVEITKFRNKDDHMIMFLKDSITKNVPDKNTFVSRLHGIYVENNKRMVPAFKLCNGYDIYPVKMPKRIIYNVLLEKQGAMKVNNMWSETLNPSNNIAKNILK